MIVLESNQNHATIHDTEVCNALPAAMGMGGGYIPMIVADISEPGTPIAIVVFANDIRVETDENEVAFSLRAREHKGVQCVAARENTEKNEREEETSPGKKPWVLAFENDVTIKIDETGSAFSLRAREYKDVQCVMVKENVERD